jgi:hypothetical protein
MKLTAHEFTCSCLKENVGRQVPYPLRELLQQSKHPSTNLELYVTKYPKNENKPSTLYTSRTSNLPPGTTRSRIAWVLDQMGFAYTFDVHGFVRMYPMGLARDVQLCDISLTRLLYLKRSGHLHKKCWRYLARPKKDRAIRGRLCDLPKQSDPKSTWRYGDFEMSVRIYSLNETQDSTHNLGFTVFRRGAPYVETSRQDDREIASICQLLAKLVIEMLPKNVESDE